MKAISLDLLVCPQCHYDVKHTGGGDKKILDGTLTCSNCSKTYPILNGIPHFIKSESLNGYNRRFAHMYDVFSRFYRAFSKVAFAYIGMKEEAGRREITDRLNPQGGKVLEVSIGPGVNLPTWSNVRM